MYALTSINWSGERIRFGIFGCDVVIKARRAVCVIPGVFAMAAKSGAMSNIRGDFSSGATTWQEEHTRCASARPAAGSPDPSCALATKGVAISAPTSNICRTRSPVANVFCPYPSKDGRYRTNNRVLLWGRQAHCKSSVTGWNKPAAGEPGFRNRTTRSSSESATAWAGGST
jgi:hypothetical protein